MSSVKKKVVEVTPSLIEFDLSNSDPSATLYIKNNNEGRLMAFKVKTTRPRRYLVRPNVELVSTTTTVKILMQRPDVRDLYQEHKNNAALPFEDLFLVQAVEVSDEWMKSVNEAKSDSKKLGKVLQEMFATKDKSDFIGKKLKCKLNIPTSPPAWLYDSSSSTSESREPLPQAVPVEAAYTNVASLRSQGSDAPEIADLRKRYNDMVHFVVQLTGERDRLKEECNKKNEEIEKLHELVESTKQSSGSSSAISCDTLWQLLVVVVIVFVIARLVT